jgi:hypothetical protein
LPLLAAGDNGKVLLKKKLSQRRKGTAFFPEGCRLPGLPIARNKDAMDGHPV